MLGTAPGVLAYVAPGPASTGSAASSGGHVAAGLRPATAALLKFCTDKGMASGREILYEHQWSVGIDMVEHAERVMRERLNELARCNLVKLVRRRFGAGIDNWSIDARPQVARASSMPPFAFGADCLLCRSRVANRHGPRLGLQPAPP